MDVMTEILRNTTWRWETRENRDYKFMVGFFCWEAKITNFSNEVLV